MTHFIGLLVVILVVFGGLLFSGGPAIFSALPLELGLIGGAALGTVLIGNSPTVAREALAGFVTAMRGPKWTREDYGALLATLHELTRRARRGGILAIENDIEQPEQSALLQANPKLLKDEPARELICDSFRLLALDPSTRDRIEAQMDETISAVVQQRHRAVSALHTLADALPALGIVAAVLGIIKTMGVIDQSPGVLGEMIAAALLGTFLGVFLAYGIVGPIASRFGQLVDEETLYLDQIRIVLSGYAKGLAPTTSIEIARGSLPADVRPASSVLDQSLTAARFTQTRQSA